MVLTWPKVQPAFPQAAATVTVISADDAYPPDQTETMPEKVEHSVSCRYILNALEVHYTDWPQPPLVIGNMDIYAEKGVRRPAFSPDAMVAFGTALATGASYRFWEAPQPPSLVMEVASFSTVPVDVGKKQKQYAALGIQEYWQYDPIGVLLPHPLQGWTLQDGAYVAIQGQETSEADWRFSEVLGTWWGLLTPDALATVRISRAWEPRLRLWNPRDSLWYPTPRGAHQLQKATEAERDQAQAERDQAQAGRERAQAERDQAQAGRERAQAERERAQAERDQAQAERDQALAQAQREAQRNRELAVLLVRLQRRATDDDPSS